MLQNRVDPFGNIIRTSARGTFTGTRGVIHNDHQEIVRPFKHKAWITCLLQFKGRRRVVMTPNRYTELFFLDEATSFAAGHRPCAECRRENFNRFKAYWIAGNPEYGFDHKTLIGRIDEILQRERITSDKSKVIHEDKWSNLPDGTFVSRDDKPFVIFKSGLYLWTPFGYDDVHPKPTSGKVTVLTPKSIVNTVRAGYHPEVSIHLHK